MAQFLRPSSNITQTSFTGGFADIDETSASDVDFAWGANNIAATLEVGLSAINPPAAGTTTVRYRIAKTNAGVLSADGNAVTITAYVYQGAALIATDTVRTTSGTWTTYTWTPDLSTVSNWSDLRLRFVTSASGGGTTVRRGGAVSWAEIETPDGFNNLVTSTTVTATTSPNLVLVNNLGSSLLITTDASAAAEGEKLVNANVSVEVTTNVNLTTRVNLESTVSVNSTTAASLLNVFNAASAVTVSGGTTAVISITKNNSGSLSVTASLTGAPVMLNSMTAALNVTTISSPPLELTKQLIGNIVEETTISPFLGMLIFSSAAINITVTTFSKLLNASEGYISGRIQNSEGQSLQRTLYLYRRSDGVKIAETTSNISTGEYQFVIPPTLIEYMVVVKESEGLGDDKIRGRILPFLIE